MPGPDCPDTGGQVKAGKGFDVTGFGIDWDQQAATCPRGIISTGWTEHTRPIGHIKIHAA